MRLELSEIIVAARNALSQQRLMAQAPGRRDPEYIARDGYVSPAGAAGVNGYCILEELPDLEMDKGELLKAALLEHAHDVWLTKGKFGTVLERMHHPSRLPPKLFQWLRNRIDVSVDLGSFMKLLDEVARYT